MTTKDEIFAAENAGESKEHLSPAGKYRLVVTTYQTGEGYWNYTQGKVYRGEKCLAEVRRNYHQFPFTFIEGHKNGHDYLVCGEDYQGQTVIELDTGERVDYRPDAAEKGHGFCWAYYKPSPNGTLIVVNGCIWACPYENHVYDFAKPMKPPWPRLFQGWDGSEDTFGWVDNDTCEISSRFDVRKSDGKRSFDMTLEELEALEKEAAEKGIDEESLWDEVEEIFTWKRGMEMKA